MNNKDKYESLEMDVIAFETIDIITDSDPNGLPPVPVPVGG